MLLLLLLPFLSTESRTSAGSRRSAFIAEAHDAAERALEGTADAHGLAVGGGEGGMDREDNGGDVAEIGGSRLERVFA